MLRCDVMLEANFTTKLQFYNKKFGNSYKIWVADAGYL